MKTLRDHMEEFRAEVPSYDQLPPHAKRIARASYIAGYCAAMGAARLMTDAEILASIPDALAELTETLKMTGKS